MLSTGAPRTLRALHIVGDLDPRFGGPSSALPPLWRALGAEGVEVKALTTHARGSDPQEVEGIRLESVARWPDCYPYYAHRLRSAMRRLLEGAEAPDIVHVHGLWIYAAWIAGRAARERRIPLVISPCGMLQPWALARHRLMKSLLLKTLDGPNLQGAAAVLPKSEREREALEAAGIPRVGPVVPNGIDPPGEAVSSDGELLARLQLRPGSYLLFLGRIHPSKGLLALAQAWTRLSGDAPGTVLAIVGPVEDSSYLTEVRGALGVSNGTVKFLGPVYGSQKSAILRNAHCLVLPSASENFGTVVAEALAHRTPVVVSSETPWADVGKIGCGWLTTRQQLEHTLRRVLATSAEERRAMGDRGHRWVVKAFTWPSVAERMASVYRPLIREAAPGPTSISR